MIVQNKHIELLRQLVMCKSITPTDSRALFLLQKYLVNIGFTVHIRGFNADGVHEENLDELNTDMVLNMYAVKNIGGTKNLCFAGHTDVVPPGDISKWQYNPFDAMVENGILYGRGAVDMKGAIIAFFAAAEHFINITNAAYNISFLLTADEEGKAIYGIKPMLQWVYNELNEKIDHCIVGEPVSKNTIGDTIKVGARGSATFVVTIYGKQGHVAYHHLADNPVKKANSILTALLEYDFKHTNVLFNKTNLEVTRVACDSGAENVIPNEIVLQFNVRYSDDYNYLSLQQLIKKILEQHLQTHEYTLHSWSSGDAFIGINNIDKSEILNVVREAIEANNNVTPYIDTAGGTSDARFIKQYCDVLEIGLLGNTAHQVNEHVALRDIEKLAAIYLSVIQNYFMVA